MHCYAILSFALHCVALHVHAFGRKNTPNWGRAGFIVCVNSLCRSLSLSELSIYTIHVHIDTYKYIYIYISLVC